ncbi:MAG: hypothetical protein RBR02_09500 [Desulfuromonadaceae bacterium]|nr:hypothetical protein [Desulfuromonadaceae bacterium]
MLTLPIKKKWFDMIASGEKKEEYREKTDYWAVRLHNQGPEFAVRFRNGYSLNSPSLDAICSYRIGKGKEEWGAEKDKNYYVLIIHEIKNTSF